MPLRPSDADLLRDRSAIELSCLNRIEDSGTEKDSDTQTSHLLPSFNAFELHRTKLGIDVLQSAIDFDNLPSRSDHLGVLIVGAPVLSASNLLARIGRLVANILYTPFFFLADKKWETLKFRACCLLLDPLHFLAEIACTVMRIAAAVLGFAMPRWAATVWQSAEHIQAFMQRGYAAVAVTGTHVSRESITPKAACAYLGYPRALEVYLEVYNDQFMTEEAKKVDLEIEKQQKLAQQSAERRKQSIAEEIGKIELEIKQLESQQQPADNFINHTEWTLRRLRGDLFSQEVQQKLAEQRDIEWQPKAVEELRRHKRQQISLMKKDAFDRVSYHS